MCVEDLTYAEEFYYSTNTLYRQTLKERLFVLGKPVVRPSLFDLNEFSGMNMFSRIMGDIGRRKHAKRIMV